LGSDDHARLPVASSAAHGATTPPARDLILDRCLPESPLHLRASSPTTRPPPSSIAASLSRCCTSERYLQAPREPIPHSRLTRAPPRICEPIPASLPPRSISSRPVRHHRPRSLLLVQHRRPELLRREPSAPHPRFPLHANRRSPHAAATPSAAPPSFRTRTPPSQPHTLRLKTDLQVAAPPEQRSALG
jgi:hypothetical protein